MKTITLFQIFVLCLVVLKPSLPISGQNVSIEITNLQVLDKHLEISYNISKSKATNRFDVFVEITNSKGQKINTRSLSGDIGQGQKGGQEKKIVWDFNADGFVLDEEIEVLVKAEVSTVAGAVNTGGCVFRSLLVPGLGLSKIDHERPYWLIGIVGYGSLGSSLYFLSSYQKNYDNYLNTSDPQEASDYFNKSQNQKELANVFMYTAIGTWSVSFIWTWIKAKQHNKSLLSSTINSRMNMYTKIDPFSRRPILSVTYKF